jgi:hypothetical protein
LMFQPTGTLRLSKVSEVSKAIRQLLIEKTRMDSQLKKLGMTMWGRKTT